MAERSRRCTYTVRVVVPYDNLNPNLVENDIEPCQLQDAMLARDSAIIAVCCVYACGVDVHERCHQFGVNSCDSSLGQRCMSRVSDRSKTERTFSSDQTAGCSKARTRDRVCYEMWPY
jgi:hypothetical protein